VLNKRPLAQNIQAFLRNCGYRVGAFYFNAPCIGYCFLFNELCFFVLSFILMNKSCPKYFSSIQQRFESIVQLKD